MGAGPIPAPTDDHVSLKGDDHVSLKGIAMTLTPSPHWLTSEAHARLVAELADLHRERTPDGEPEQLVHDRHRQGRIRELEGPLQHAVVGQDPPDDGIAEPGMVLTLGYDDGATEVVLLGARTVDDLEVCSPDSPLGRALHGAKPGEQREYPVPSGAVVRVTLVDACPYGHYRRGE